MVLAVGDSSHSLATAKAYWEELKPTLSEEQRKTHPARWSYSRGLQRPQPRH